VCGLLHAPLSVVNKASRVMEEKNQLSYAAP
jgi:hypothetical protein